MTSRSEHQVASESVDIVLFYVFGIFVLVESCESVVNEVELYVILGTGNHYVFQFQVVVDLSREVGDFNGWEKVLDYEK